MHAQNNEMIWKMYSAHTGGSILSCTLSRSALTGQTNQVSVPPWSTVLVFWVFMLSEISIINNLSHSSEWNIVRDMSLSGYIFTWLPVREISIPVFCTKYHNISHTLLTGRRLLFPLLADFSP